VAIRRSPALPLHGAPGDRPVLPPLKQGARRGGLWPRAAWLRCSRWAQCGRLFRRSDGRVLAAAFALRINPSRKPHRSDRVRGLPLARRWPSWRSAATSLVDTSKIPCLVWGLIERRQAVAGLPQAPGGGAARTTWRCIGLNRTRGHLDWALEGEGARSARTGRSAKAGGPNWLQAAMAERDLIEAALGSGCFGFLQPSSPSLDRSACLGPRPSPPAFGVDGESPLQTKGGRLYGPTAGTSADCGPYWSLGAWPIAFLISGRDQHPQASGAQPGDLAWAGVSPPRWHATRLETEALETACRPAGPRLGQRRCGSCRAACPARSRADSRTVAAPGATWRSAMAWRLCHRALQPDRAGRATGGNSSMPGPVSVAAPACPAVPMAWRFLTLLAHTHGPAAGTTRRRLLGVGVQAWVARSSGRPGPERLVSGHALRPLSGERLLQLASTPAPGYRRRCDGLGPALQSCSRGLALDSVAPTRRPAAA